MNASAVTGVITGGLLGAMADAPWWGSCAVVVIIFGICHAAQLVDAWNKLLRGPHERRALREAQATDVLAYLIQTPGVSTQTQSATETSTVDAPPAPGAP